MEERRVALCELCLAHGILHEPLEEEKITKSISFGGGMMKCDTKNEITNFITLSEEAFCGVQKVFSKND